MNIRITRDVAARLRRHAADAHPMEACGLLLGDPDAVARCTWAANVADDPASRFEIDPAALIAALKAERAGGPGVIGYWHSHPSGLAEPSATDRAMAARDGKLWAIVAVDAIGWWRAGTDGFERLDVIVTD